MSYLRFKGNLIRGRFLKRRGRTERLTSEDPGQLKCPLGEVGFSVEAVHDAVEAARDAFRTWSLLPQKRRASFLGRFRRILRRELDDLAFLITREMGKTLEESRGEVHRIIAKVDIARRYEKELVREYRLRAGHRLTAHCRFRPRGVLAILPPFNVPAHLASSLTISGLLTGNTVILKPSELVPFVGQKLALIWQEAGLPPGVFNLVQGAGKVGQALVTHPGVDGVFFTGSWATGSRIQTQLARDGQKICALEMGGKNSAILCRDAHLDQAVEEIFTGAFMTTGQRCNATSRVLVEKPIADEFLHKFLNKVDRMKIGYGTKPGVFMGPMASRKGYDQVLKYLRLARREGFTALRNGGPLPYERKGYYLKPSIHLREGIPSFQVKDGTYTDDEILGPDTAVYIVRSLEEAIRINNRSRYGLVTSVFTRSRRNFEKVLNTAQNGLIHWNVATVRSSARLPFGGLKRSGNDRPVGIFSSYLCTIPTASMEKVPAG